MGADQFKRGMLFVTAAVILTFMCGPATAPAEEKQGQETTGQSLFSEVGLVTGYGQAAVVEGRYETVLTILHLGIDAARFFPSLSSHKGKLSFIIEPQYNPVLEPEKTYEFGLGLGLQYAYPLSQRFSPYVLAVTGPHYVDVCTRTQARGFIFSNTLGAGAYFFLTEKAAVNAGYRLRHMSNAYTHSPNHGIDSHFAVLGFSYFF